MALMTKPCFIPTSKPSGKGSESHWADSSCLLPLSTAFTRNVSVFNVSVGVLGGSVGSGGVSHGAFITCHPAVQLVKTNNVSVCVCLCVSPSADAVA